ncbi:hypothetical protein BH11ACT7_BH11ACT7_32080 [soil metagenome]
MRDVEDVVLPELRRHGVRFIQVGRTAAGLSQTKRAQLAGISRVYLNTVEAANKCPTVVVLVHLARGLGVDPAQLLEKQPV